MQEFYFPYCKQKTTKIIIAHPTIHNNLWKQKCQNNGSIKILRTHIKCITCVQQNQCFDHKLSIISYFLFLCIYLQN